MIRPGVSAIIVVVGTAVVRPTTGRMVSRVPGPVSVVGGAAGGASGARALPVSVRGAASVTARSGGDLPVAVRLAATPGVSAGGGIGPVVVSCRPAVVVRVLPGGK